MSKIEQNEIQKQIYTIRDLQAMLDSDLAELYGVKTKRLSVTKIAKDIGLSRCKCSIVINRMVRERKLFKKGDQYQFNEHYEEWVLQKDKSVNKSEQLVLTKMNSSITKRVTVVLAKVNSSVTKKVTHNL